MRIYHTTVAKESGETLAQAIARAAVFAGNHGYDGYEIRCGECNERINPCHCEKSFRKDLVERRKDGEG